MNQTIILPAVITIDGPSGAGKGTIGQRLAKEKGWYFLESGAIYRILAWVVKENRIHTDNEDQLVELAERLNFQFVLTPEGVQIFCQHHEIGQAIYSQEISELASKIAVNPRVRQVLLEKQRSFRKDPGLVADGRDMGTVVFPDAKVKIFLTASLIERAKRRQQQLLERGDRVKMFDLIKELSERDARDQQRTISPLKPADDAHIIDTTHLTIDEVMDHVKEIIERSN